MNRVGALDDLPAEVHQLNFYKPWWYGTAGALLVLSGLAVGGILAAHDASGWLGWTGNVFQAVQATLSLFLVILTYNLFAAASRVTEQTERIHRISQLPIVVADVMPLSFDPYPSYQIRIMNEGSGPALDIDVTVDYRHRDDDRPPPPSSVPSSARLRIGVMNKSSHTGLLIADARGIMTAKPWHGLDVARDGPPTRLETEALLEPYALVVRITYKDIYSQAGRTTYEALQASGDLGLELTELIAPAVQTGSDVKPIVFASGPSMESVLVTRG